MVGLCTYLLARYGGDIEPDCLDGCDRAEAREDAWYGRLMSSTRTETTEPAPVPGVDLHRMRINLNADDRPGIESAPRGLQTVIADQDVVPNIDPVRAALRWAAEAQQWHRRYEISLWGAACAFTLACLFGYLWLQKL